MEPRREMQGEESRFGCRREWEKVKKSVLWSSSIYHMPNLTSQAVRQGIGVSSDQDFL